MSAGTGRPSAATPRPASGVLPLGRVAGVPVGAHWSVLGIVAVVTLVLGRGELPALAPGHSAAAYAVAGLVAAVGLVLSLLAHEVAHAAVCRAHGLRVDGITLWLLGSVTRIRDAPERAGTELRVAIAGPLTSGLLGGAFALAAVALRPASSTLVVAVLAELAVINLVLAVFNLLPAAPLDGGRVLRAVLWARRDDRWTAALSAARAGRALGLGLVVLGLATALTTGPGGLWLALLGWFIGSAAADEERRDLLARALSGRRVGEAAGSRPMVLPAATSAADLVAALAALPAGAAEGGVLLVRHGDGAPSAFVPPERLAALRSADDPGRALRRLAVPAERLWSATPHDALSPLLGHLAEPDARLVVVEGEEVVATVAAADVVALAARMDAEPGPTQEEVPPGTPPPPGWWWHGGPAAGPPSSDGATVRPSHHHPG